MDRNQSEKTQAIGILLVSSNRRLESRILKDFNRQKLVIKGNMSVKRIILFCQRDAGKVSRGEKTMKTLRGFDGATVKTCSLCIFVWNG